jgi:AcrR family transcriptional regulator
VLERPSPTGPSAPAGGAEAPRVRAAVLRTIIAELLRTGYAGLSVEAVAERASVHKTSTAASSPRGTDPTC